MRYTAEQTKLATPGKEYRYIVKIDGAIRAGFWSAADYDYFVVSTEGVVQQRLSRLDWAIGGEHYLGEVAVPITKD